jgi:hypothetical protein
VACKAIYGGSIPPAASISESNQAQRSSKTCKS